MKYVDNFLNGITMYRLLLYGLSSLALIVFLFSYTHLLSYSLLSLFLSLICLLASCFVFNYIFAWVFKVEANIESFWISAFILFFVLDPATSLLTFSELVLAAFLSMASKYFLVVNKKHIFNPVAISLFVLTLLKIGIVTWWVASDILLIFTAVLGFLILRKVQRFTLFFSFFVVSVLSYFIFFGLSLGNFFSSFFFSFPVIFLGTIMLTEPQTTPPKRNLQIAYGAIVGFLFGAQFSFGPIYSTPEFALIIGNIFSFVVSPKWRLMLTLKEKNQLSKDVYEFVWQSDKKISYEAGQYMEWTLGQEKPDTRGNRRYFTLSSSPTEENLLLGVKFYDKSSTFKKKLLSLTPGAKISAASLSGEFTLPEDMGQKLVFIAGGIGITPFRSIIKNLSDNKEKRDVVLLFSNKSSSDIVYKNIFDQAEKDFRLKTLYMVGEGSVSGNIRIGRIDENLIKNEIPDYKDRKFYISGPHAMIVSFEDTLKKMGIPRSNIKTDFFPGYV